jgi:hypothetical protein
VALTIWKYPLTLEPLQKFKLPVVNVLSVQVQLDPARGVAEDYANEGLSMWVLVDDTLPERPVEVRLATTGEELDRLFAYSRFLNTVQLRGGAFVLHVFVRTGAGV